MNGHYSAIREERTSRQGGRIYDYDSEENDLSSKDSDEPVDKEGDRRTRVVFYCRTDGLKQID
jgi:hypothetical protein